jgi:hypothetical protein
MHFACTDVTVFLSVYKLLNVVFTYILTIWTCVCIVIPKAKLWFKSGHLVVIAQSMDIIRLDKYITHQIVSKDSTVL